MEGVWSVGSKYSVQCLNTEHQGSMSKIYVGPSVQNAIVWKLLLKNQCLNNMFWNMAGGDFK